ncbi:MAG: hypothetical protein M3O35_06210 [Acidobacteriota bacterium]|nr:hypothetical protein [Acidobacteriota bacterium]
MNYRSALRFPTSVVILTAGLSTLCLAQSAKSRVTITHVKPEMLIEWVDLQKNEVVPALKKAGIKTRTVYSSGLFGNSYEYVVVTPMEKFADFDAGNPLVKALGETASARLGEKLRKCTLSSQSFMSTRLDDLSNPSESSEPPPIITSTRLRIAPGKMPEFESIVKTDVLPVFKKAKAPYTVLRRGLGANPNDVTITTPHGNWADLDAPAPFVKALGAEGAAKVLAKFTGVSTVIETVARTRAADLSF